MLTSLDQLFEHYNVPKNATQTFRDLCKPRQQNYTSLLPQKPRLFRKPVELHNLLIDCCLYKVSNNLFHIVKRKGSHLFTETGELIVQEGSSNTEPILLMTYNETLFQQDLKKYNSFWEWKTNRNPTRFGLENEYFFDTKHAMHLVRLLRMGYEALTEGIIKVKRPDAQELLSIRNGAWTYEQVVEYAEFMKEEVDRALKLQNLPDAVDSRFAGNLVMQIQDSVWRR